MAPMKPRRTTELIVGIVIALILLGSIGLAYSSFRAEQDTAAQPQPLGTTDKEDRLELHVKVSTIDPIKGTVTLSVNPSVNGSLSKDEGFSAVQPIFISAYTDTGVQQKAFKAGEPLNAFDITVSIEGEVFEYPFDTHKGSISFLVETAKPPPPPATDESGTPSPAPTVAAEDREALPAIIDVSGSVAGFAYDLQPDPESGKDEGYYSSNIEITRSPLVKIIVIAAMTIMWLVSLGVLILGLAVPLRFRKSEPLALFSGLLFAVITFRNALPGTPAFGTLSDYLCFFWVLLIIAVVLIAMIYYTLRPPVAPTK